MIAIYVHMVWLNMQLNVENWRVESWGYKKQSRGMNKKLCEETRVFARSIYVAYSQWKLLNILWMNLDIYRMFIVDICEYFSLICSCFVCFLLYRVHFHIKIIHKARKFSCWGSQETNYIIPLVLFYYISEYIFFSLWNTMKTTQFIFTLLWTCLIFVSVFF